MKCDKKRNRNARQKSQPIYHASISMRSFYRGKIGIVTNWDVFEKTVRVSADLYGLGDHGLGVGLLVQRRRSGEVDNNDS